MVAEALLDQVEKVVWKQVLKPRFNLKEMMEEMVVLVLLIMDLVEVVVPVALEVLEVQVGVVLQV